MTNAQIVTIRNKLMPTFLYYTKDDPSSFVTLGVGMVCEDVIFYLKFWTKAVASLGGAPGDTL